MKVVVVGQAPGANSGRRAFDGRSGDRLARYMGLEGREELLEAVDAFNVLDRYPGSEGPKGDAFPISWARRRARRLYPRLRGRTVLLAGKRVATAFGIKSDYLRWEDHPEGFRVAVIPHPSGVNHWWNEPANRRRFRRFVEEEMRGCT